LGIVVVDAGKKVDVLFPRYVIVGRAHNRVDPGRRCGVFGFHGLDGGQLEWFWFTDG